jgi:hypothetical protein
LFGPASRIDWLRYPPGRFSACQLKRCSTPHDRASFRRRLNPARRNESSVSTVTLSQLEAENATVKCKRAIQVGHLEMHVANPSVGMDRWSV